MWVVNDFWNGFDRRRGTLSLKVAKVRHSCLLVDLKWEVRVSAYFDGDGDLCSCYDDGEKRKLVLQRSSTAPLLRSFC